MSETLAMRKNGLFNTFSKLRLFRLWILSRVICFCLDRIQCMAFFSKKSQHFFMQVRAIS